MLEQRITMDGLQEGEIEFLAEVGKAWGIYTDDTAEMLGTVDKALKDSKGNAEAFLDVFYKADKTFTFTVITRYETQGSPSPAAGEAGIGPPGPSTVPDVDTGGPVPGGGGAYQHGGSFIIPPGYNENFPIGPNGVAGSGERVTITPRGQSGGGGAEYQMMLLQMEGRMTRAFRDALMLARG